MTSAVSEIELAPNEKRCSKCKEVKDRGEFSIKRASRDGLDTSCKNCHKEKDLIKYRKTHPIIVRRSIDPEASYKACSKCGELKLKQEFYPDNRTKDGRQSSCSTCDAEAARIRRQKSNENKSTIVCDICGGSFQWLYPHLRKFHHLSQSEIENSGYKNSTSPELHKAWQHRSRVPRPHTRKNGEVTIGEKHISFPREYWPTICKYVGIIVSKDKKQVRLKPYLKSHPFTKRVNIQPFGPFGHRVRIVVPNKILHSLDVKRDIELLGETEKKGFIINFTDKDDPLLDILDIWARSGKSITNTANLTIGRNKHISISPTIWPDDGKYALLTYKSSRSKNGFIEIIPINKNGEVITKNGYTSIDRELLSKKLKVTKPRTSNRFLVAATKFLNGTCIPSSDWDFVETLPSGALRFRLYKERQPKEQSEDIAS